MGVQALRVMSTGRRGELSIFSRGYTHRPLNGLVAGPFSTMVGCEKIAH